MLVVDKLAVLWVVLEEVVMADSLGLPRNVLASEMSICCMVVSQHYLILIIVVTMVWYG